MALVAGLIATTAWAYADRRDRQLAAAFVRDLATVPWDDLARKVRELDGHRGYVEAALHARLDGGPIDPELRSRIALALLHAESARAAELADRLLSCGPDEHRAIRQALGPRRSQIAPRLGAVLDAPGSAPEWRVRAAAALIALDGPDPDPAGPFPEAEPAWSLLRAAEVPDLRVELIDWLVRSRIGPRAIAGRLDSEPDPSIRRVLVQVLAELGDAGGAPPSISPALMARLATMYRDDPDPGVHSGLGYLLGRWGMDRERADLDAELACRPPGDRRWLVSAIGQTLAIVGPIGSSPGGAPRRLAIATTETTVEQYRPFDPGHETRAAPGRGATPTEPDAPVNVVSFHEAARFCNWLSEKEGLPRCEWCYVPGDTPGTMVLTPHYRSRRGYRLPTLSEWEYAARGGTATDRYFGRSPRSAGDYAWYNRNTDNHPEPVGRKRPNDLGLFDVLGNLLEWCHNPDPPHNEGCDCRASRGAECGKVRMVSVRGGCYFQAEGGLTAVGYSPTLDRVYPSEAFRYVGFRVVRSVP